MARKSRPPTSIYDTDKGTFRYICSEPGCGHEMSKEGRWYKTHPEFQCPGCGHYVVMTDEDRLGLFANEVARLEALFGRH